MKRYDFGTILRLWQTEYRVSNVELAKHFGVSSQQVLRWRKSKSVQLCLIENIAEYFERSTIDFLEEFGDKGKFEA